MAQTPGCAEVVRTEFGWMEASVRKIAGISFLLIGATPLLSGCGNSHPSPQSTAASGAAPATAAPTYVPAKGVFVQEASALAGSPAPRTVADCNVDSIDGKQPDGASLARASSAAFAGWAADSSMGAVPKHVQLVLKGAGGEDFAMEIATGETRADVAQAQKNPSFAASGWAAQADLSAVAPGRYDAVLLYQIDGKPVICDPHHVVSIR